MDIGFAGLLNTLSDLVTTWGVKVVGAIVVLIVGRMIAASARRAVRRVLRKGGTDESNLGDSSVDLVVRPWCIRDDYWPLRFARTRALKEELERAGCNIPFPQRDVHLREVKQHVA